jgi:hypothetical protein
MTNETIVSLGRWQGILKSKDAGFLESILDVLPKAFRNDLVSNTVLVNIDDPNSQTNDPGLAITQVINEALRHHEDLLWIDASCLKTNDNKLVLIAGDSMSGKTTISLAFAGLENWKILAEDIALIDFDNNQILNFARPLSLREGSLDRIKRIKSFNFSKPLLNNWYYDPFLYLNEPESLNIELAVLLSKTLKEEGTPIKGKHQPPPSLQVTRLEPESFVRALLPISNLLHKPQSLALKLSQCLKNATCLELCHGELDERMQAISKLLS